MNTKPTNPRRTLFGKNKYEYVPYSVYCKKGRKEAVGERRDNTILLYCVQFHIVEIYRVKEVLRVFRRYITTYLIPYPSKFPIIKLKSLLSKMDFG